MSDTFDSLKAQKDVIQSRINAKERLDELLTLRAKYHHTEEWERPSVIVKYMDQRISELERSTEKW